MKAFQLISFLICISFFSINASQTQINLPDEIVQETLIFRLSSLQGPELRREVKKLSGLNKQYNRVMKKPSIIKFIIKKTLEPLLTQEAYIRATNRFWRDPLYSQILANDPEIAHYTAVKQKIGFIPTKKQFDIELEKIYSNPKDKNLIASQDFKDIVTQKNNIFNIIVTQIKPELDKLGIGYAIDVINGKDGINTVDKTAAQYQSPATALSRVIRYKFDPAFVKLMLQAGANPNIFMQTIAMESFVPQGLEHIPPLILIIFLDQSSQQIVNYLKNKVDGYLTEEQKLAMVKLLVEYDEEINVIYKHPYATQETALKQAIYKAYPTIVQFLLENGADPQVGLNRKPLEYARFERDNEPNQVRKEKLNEITAILEKYTTKKP